MRQIQLTFWLLLTITATGQLPGPFHLTASVKRYDTARHNRLLQQFDGVIDDVSPTFIQTRTGKWQISTTTKPYKNRTGVKEILIHYYLLEGSADNSSVSFSLERKNWSVQNFVFTPGSTYNGNRFESRPIPYSPRLMHPKDVGRDAPPIITDIPRLNNYKGVSRMQLTTGSAAYPLMGFWDSAAQSGYFIETTQRNSLGDYGMDIEENNQRTTASFTISSPHVREQYRYYIANNSFPSDDKPANFKQGDSVAMWCRVHEFKAADMASFYQYYFNLQQELLRGLSFHPALPFSAAYDLIAAKYNRLNWNPIGFYSIDAAADNRQWKPGWVGGMPAAYALWLGSDSLTKSRLTQQNNWVLQHGLSPSGLFYERFIEGIGWLGGDPSKFHTKQWHLVRSSADALYYTIKLLEQIK
jgi:hypothetical protein